MSQDKIPSLKQEMIDILERLIDEIWGCDHPKELIEEAKEVVARAHASKKRTAQR